MKEIQVSMVFSGENITENELNDLLIDLAESKGWSVGGGLNTIDQNDLRSKKNVDPEYVRGYNIGYDMGSLSPALPDESKVSEDLELKKAIESSRKMIMEANPDFLNRIFPYAAMDESFKAGWFARAKKMYNRNDMARSFLAGMNKMEDMAKNLRFAPWLKKYDKEKQTIS